LPESALLEVDPMFKTTLIALATFATLALSASPSETAAAEASVTGNVLRKTVSGKTVYLKISGFELPIRYSAGGSMTGSMSMVAAALSRGDGASDRGKWWDLRRSALPALDELDGRQVLLLQTHA
jgi:hypothetical protein